MGVADTEPVPEGGRFSRNGGGWAKEVGHKKRIRSGGRCMGESVDKNFRSGRLADIDGYV